MEQLRLKSNYLVSSVSTSYVRTLTPEVDWDKPLVGIIGPRGVGKTTLLLQQIKLRYGFDPQSLYINLDDIYLAGMSLHDFAGEFSSRGGKHLFIDEIQKHPQWSLELKNIYETLPHIKITFAGSSTIEMVKHYANLSKRAQLYNLGTLSFREYLAFIGIAQLPQYDLQTLLTSHIEIAAEHLQDFSPNLHLNNYLTRGCYPYGTESYEQYKRQLELFVADTVDKEMASIEGFDIRNAHKVKQLIAIIAGQAPFKPNLVQISDTIGVHRNTLISYFFHLEKAKLINLIYPAGVNVSILQKPERVYLSNSNLANLLSPVQPERVALAQTFAINQLTKQNQVALVNKHIFEVNNEWHTVITTPAQRIRKTPTGNRIYTISDGYEVGTSQKVPLWLLGLVS